MHKPRRPGLLWGMCDRSRPAHVDRLQCPSRNSRARNAEVRVTSASRAMTRSRSPRRWTFDHNAIPQQADVVGNGFHVAGQYWVGVRFCAGFSDIGITHVATVSGRCSRSAKARSRGRLSAGGAAGSMAIVLEHGASDDERRTPRDRWCDHIGEPDRCQSRWTVVAIDRVARSRGCSSRLDAIEAACRRCRPTASTKFAQ